MNSCGRLVVLSLPYLSVNMYVRSYAIVNCFKFDGLKLTKSGLFEFFEQLRLKNGMFTQQPSAFVIVYNYLPLGAARRTSFLPVDLLSILGRVKNGASDEIGRENEIIIITRA